MEILIGGLLNIAVGTVFYFFQRRDQKQLAERNERLFQILGHALNEPGRTTIRVDELGYLIGNNFCEADNKLHLIRVREDGSDRLNAESEEE